jgi:hypothetical protein
VQERSEHIAEWVRLAEDSKLGQLDPVSARGRTEGRGNEGGIRRASRELPLSGASAEVLDAAGQRSPFAEFDHFYASSHPDPEHTWLICKPCHTGLTTGRVSRDQREAEFRAYQSKRRRLAGQDAPLL